METNPLNNSRDKIVRKINQLYQVADDERVNLPDVVANSDFASQWIYQKAQEQDATVREYLMEMLQLKAQNQLTEEQEKYVDEVASRGPTPQVTLLHNAMGNTQAERCNMLATYDNRLSHSDAYRKLNFGTPAMFSNEWGVDQTIKNLAQQKLFPVNASICRVGIMVSESNLIHMLPELSRHVDLVILADFDNLVLQNIQHQLFCLRIAETKAQFLDFYADPKLNPILRAGVTMKVRQTQAEQTLNFGSMQQFEAHLKKMPDTPVDKDLLLKRMVNQDLRLGGYGMYLNEERFVACKAAVSNMRFVSAPGNWFETDYIQQLSECFMDDSNKRIGILSLLNVSNLYHYDGPYPLDKLEFSEYCNTPWVSNQKLIPNLRLLCEGQKRKPLILFSEIKLQPGKAKGHAKKLHSLMVEGVDAFAALAENDCKLLIEKHGSKIQKAQYNKAEKASQKLDMRNNNNAPPVQSAGVLRAHRVPRMSLKHSRDAIIHNVNQLYKIDDHEKINFFELLEEPQSCLTPLFNAVKESDMQGERLMAAANAAQQQGQLDTHQQSVIKMFEQFGLADYIKDNTEGRDQLVAAMGADIPERCNLLATFHDQLPHSDDYRQSNYGKPAMFSNEWGTQETIAALAQQKPIENKAGLCRVAVLVSESNLIHMLPELSRHVDLVILADFDTLVLKNIQYQLLCLRGAQKQEDFLDKYIFEQSNPILAAKLKVRFYKANEPKPTPGKFTEKQLSEMTPERNMDKESLCGLMAEQTLRLGEYSVYDNEARFHACQAAAKKLQFVCAPGNWLDKEFMTRLRSVLFDGSGNQVGMISVMNVSNIHHYDGPFPLLKIKDLQTVPWVSHNKLIPNFEVLLAGQQAQPCILYSKYGYDAHGKTIMERRSTLRSQLAIGLTQFKEAIIKDCTTIIDEYGSALQKSSKSAMFQAAGSGAMLLSSNKGTKGGSSPVDPLRALQNKYRSKQQRKKSKRPGKTATLIAAVKADSLADVKTLVEDCEVDINNKNGQGETAIQIARDCQLAEIEQYLQSRLSLKNHPAIPI